jgi:hypothetical protein
VDTFGETRKLEGLQQALQMECCTVPGAVLVTSDSTSFTINSMEYNPAEFIAFHRTQTFRIVFTRLCKIKAVP